VIPDPNVGYEGWSRVMGTIGKERPADASTRRPPKKAPRQLALPVPAPRPETAEMPERAA